jgi:sulfatase maturation enzyme AslB (radical SAM superfamily)
LPFLTERYNLSFYGGEPLLCFDLILRTLDFQDKKNRECKKTVRYSITTNGSLITEDIVRVLADHKFSIFYSFDGLAHEVHRKPDNFDRAVSVIKEIQKFSDIHLEVNSVFTPETVGLLSESMEFVMNLGIADINLSLSYIQPWDRGALSLLDGEFKKLREILISRRRKTGEIPIISFREEKGVFYCAGGQDRLSVDSEEHIWGCDLFGDYFRGKEMEPEYHEYFFGDFDTFAKQHKKIFPRVSSNYAGLSLDNFETPRMKCLFCENLEACTVCPIAAAFSGLPLGKVPPYVCEIQKMKVRHIQWFRKEIK